MINLKQGLFPCFKANQSEIPLALADGMNDGE